MNRLAFDGAGGGLRVVLVGAGPLFHSLAGAVQGAGGELAAVVTAERRLPPGCPPRLARAGINRGPILRRLRALDPDLILVGSWPEKLGPELLGTPRLGCVNCHPSLLPAHRGPNPYLSAIVAGAARTGVTFHCMTERWDAGPILRQGEVPIEPDDTGGTLRARCAGIAAELLPGLIAALRDGTPPPAEQDEARASYFPLPTPRDLEVEWRQPPERIRDWIRGVRPWLRCSGSLGGRRVPFERCEGVARAGGGGRPGEVLAVTADRLVVATGTPGAAVAVQTGRSASFPLRWRRTGVRVGMRFGAAG